jgi:class 3 adenylate cyclase
MAKRTKQKERTSSKKLHKGGTSSAINQSKTPFGHVIEGYERALFLGDFIEAGRVPIKADVETAVCFADLRGFTRHVHTLQSKSQDTRIQEFLGAYFQIFPKAVLEAVYALEPEKGNAISTQGEQVRNSIVPSMFKTLGDGMMLVWELHGEKTIQDAVAARILQIVATIRKLFRRLVEHHVRGSTGPYSAAVGDLRMGFGLARGRAWRLDFGKQRPVDYAGTIVNIAARLQDIARPEGIVAELGFCDPVFRRPAGQRDRVLLKGIEHPVDIWASNDVRLEASNTAR